MKGLILFLSVVLLASSSTLWAKKRTSGESQNGFAVHEALVAADESLEEGQSAAAEQRLQSIAAPGVWAFWKSALLARSKLSQDKSEEALDLLSHLPPPPSEIMNKNQSFYRKLYKEALETGRAAADRLSQSPSQSHDEWSRKLWAFFPDLEDPVSPVAPDGVRLEDKVARLHILFQKSLFETIPQTVSLSEIAEGSLPAEDKCRALFEWGFALRKLGKKAEAAEGLGQVERSSCEGRLMARALYWKGVTESELKQDDAAIDTFNRLAKRSTDGKYTDDAYYRLFGLYQSQNDGEKAARALRQLTELPEGDMKEKYLWETAFGAYQGQDYEKASGFLDQVLATRDMGTEAQPQALYWQARIAEIRSDKRLGGASAGMYRKVTKDYPYSFYSLFAETRLGKSAATASVAKSKPALPAEGDLADGMRVVDELNRKKDHEAAADALDYLTHLHPEIAKATPELIAQRWMDSGDFNRSLEMATERFDTSVFDINLKKDEPMTRALYPLAYPEDVKRASKTNRLPVALIEGIMREESLFLRGVRSHAGAIGLMQLMPATARTKARSLGVAYSKEALSDPASNILLGSSFLRQMMDRFGNQTALAVMAYNAGPGNVSKWVQSQGGLPLDEFIESIPFSETRGYVKRVLRSAHIYGQLWGNPARLVPSLDPPQ